MILDVQNDAKSEVIFAPNPYISLDTNGLNPRMCCSKLAILEGLNSKPVKQSKQISLHIL